MPLPLRTRQWILLAGLWLLFGGAVAWDLFSDHATTDKREYERLENLAKVIDENIELQLVATDAALKSIRGDLPFLMMQENAQPLLNQRLRAMANGMAAVRTLQILDADGRVSASNRGDLIGRNLHERAYFKAAQENPDSTVLHVLPPFMTSFGDKAMSVSRAILDERGKFAGVIAGTLDPDYVNKLLNSVRYAPDMWTALNYGEGGTFLLLPVRQDIEVKGRASPGTPGGNREDGKPIVRAAAATEEGPMIAVRTVRPAEVSMDKALEVAVARDPAAVFSDWRRDAYQQGGFLMFLIVLSSIGLTYFQRRQPAYGRPEDAANLVKSPLIVNIMHRVRISMDGIVGMVNILRRDGTTAQQAMRLDAIKASAQSQLGTIGNVLDLAKIEAGKLVLEEAPVIVESLLNNVVLILSRQAAAKGNRMRIELGDRLPYPIVGDTKRLQQALLNYASNAIQFTEDGTITLRSVTEDDSGGFVRVRFEVQDSGSGIAPERIPALFDAAPTDDGASTHRNGGSGLGLLITRRLAELMGGEVGAESRPGEGSTFWLTVMLKKKVPGEAASSVRQPLAAWDAVADVGGGDRRAFPAQADVAMLMDVRMPLAHAAPSLGMVGLPVPPITPAVAVDARGFATEPAVIVDDVPVRQIDLDDLAALGALPKA